MTLYRKYRPQNFEQLVGQEHINQTLRNAVARDLVSHAYLFTGPRGTGKTSTARILAKVINCEQVTESQNPCLTCPSCQQIGEGSLLDIVEIDAASNRGIDEIRDLKYTLQFQPSFVKNKVYIIDEVHMLTKEAFNALLKTLEEPPDYAYFILATTEIDKIPETILSRCQRFDFRRLNEKVIVDQLAHVCQEEKIKSEPEALALIAKVSDGGLRDALSLLDQLQSLYTEITGKQVADFLGHTESALCEEYINSVLSGDLVKALATVKKISEDGYQIEQAYKDILGQLRETFLQCVKEGAALDTVLEFITKLEANFELFHKSAIAELMLEVTAAQVTQPQTATTQINLTPTEKTIPAKIDQPPRSARPLKENATPKLEAPLEKVAPKAEEIIPKPKTEPLPQKSDLPEASLKPAITPPSLDLKAHELKHLWSKVVEKTLNPMLRVTLKQAQVLGLSGTELRLACNSQFHLAQLNQGQNIVAIETTIKEVFGASLTISFDENLLATPPIADDFDAPLPSEPPQTNAFKSEENAFDIFSDLAADA